MLIFLTRKWNDARRELEGSNIDLAQKGQKEVWNRLISARKQLEDALDAMKDIEKNFTRDSYG